MRSDGVVPQFVARGGGVLELERDDQQPGTDRQTAEGSILRVGIGAQEERGIGAGRRGGREEQSESEHNRRQSAHDTSHIPMIVRIARATMSRNHAWAWVGAAVLMSSATLAADTMYTRDGRRFEGVVVAMRDGVVEFEVRRGTFGRDRIRVDRADIDRIDFDRFNDSGNSYDNDFGGGGGGLGSGNGNNGPGVGRPSGMRERDVSVRANAAWQDTGITVRAGQTIYVNASGRVRWGPGRQDGPPG